jgi:UDP-N-acetylmuramoyl-tripeptide--D-alanyl-D-alanine ligase
MGSMLELGEISDEAHAALGRRLAACKAEKVFLFGIEIGPAAEVLGAGIPNYRPLFFYTADRDELSRALDSYVESGDLVLLKGSRGCELEALTGMLLGDANVS